MNPILLAAAMCGALQGFSVPSSAIGLPTSGAIVQSATSEDGFCKVTGIVKPVSAKAQNLEFEVNLPLKWNGVALQMGGGGYDGSLVTGLTQYTLQPTDAETPLKQGYVTLGSDGGHKGKAGFDGTFALDDETLINYGRQSVKKTHDAAMAVIKKAYGRAPQRFYFIGGSQGGHEALDAAARYPDDYDGVVAHYPAYDVTMLHLGSLNVGRALYADGGKAWINPKKTKMIGDAVYATCDGLDGVKDGIISNVAACDKAFDVKSLRCPSGEDTGDTCLSDPQLKAVATITAEYRPGYAIAGLDSFPKWALLEGATFTGPSNFGTVPQPSNPLSGKEALLYSVGDQTLKFIITRNTSFDPMTFDPRQWQAQTVKAGTIMDVSDVSLEKFRAKGGKIIMTHGTADDFITPHNSIAYYKRQLAQFGQQKLDGFMRFYVVPGLGHGFGIFNAKFDSLSALRSWVENGKPPVGLVAVDGNTGPTKGRTRPLCEFPKWPKFTGVLPTAAAPGDLSVVNQAGSFTCVN
jgi:feruloyl esterase